MVHYPTKASDLPIWDYPGWQTAFYDVLDESFFTQDYGKEPTRLVVQIPK
jgi:hypothetical protein